MCLLRAQGAFEWTLIGVNRHVTLQIALLFEACAATWMRAFVREVDNILHIPIFVHSLGVIIELRHPLESHGAQGAFEWMLIGMRQHMCSERSLQLKSLGAQCASKWTLIGMRHHVSF
jgi:hypothetical protein